MSQHLVKTEWAAKPHPQNPATYSRDHIATISGETKIAVTAAAEYLGNPMLADPEQLLVAAVSSCHMLYFLALCEGGGYSVASYTDNAIGYVEKNDAGALCVSSIILRPLVSFASDKIPGADALKRLHERAHKGCFIANSIKTEVTLEI